MKRKKKREEIIVMMRQHRKPLSEAHKRMISERMSGVNHPMYGKHHSEESKKKMSESHIGIQSGERNSNWVGDRVKRTGLHAWVRKHLPSQSICEKCGCIPKRLELSNKIRMYNRNLDNWWYLCVRCHREYDDTMKYLKLGRAITNKPKDHSKTICAICDSRETYIRKSDGYPDWYYINGQSACSKCYAKEKRRQYKLVKKC